MKNLPLIIALSFLTFFSCREEVIDIDRTTEIEEPIEIPGYDPEVKLITGDLFGQVIDENDNPVENAEINVGSKIVLTDRYGTFSFEDLQMNENGTFVTAEKEDYVLGSRLFYPSEGEQSRVTIKLIPKSLPGLIQADQGGRIDVAGGAQVVFESNSFVRQDGSEYLGNVNVFTKFLDPTLSSTLDEMPGALVGIRPFDNNEEVALVSYGMLMVELETEEGQKLNLADNAEAEIRIPIPESLKAEAPSEIPLWHFNEDIGRWVEEGFATVENGFYIGKVKHFTFWNCDFPNDLVNLKIKVISQDGSPYRNGKVTLKISGQSNHASDWTDNNGIAKGKVPASVNLDAHIYDLCGNLIYTESIGSFSQDSETEITLESNGYAETTISGTLRCGDESLDRALLIVNVGTEKLFYNVNSTFSVKLFICPEQSGQVTCQFYDVDENKESTAYTINIEEENDLDLVNICGEEIDEYISFNIDGEDILMLEPSMKRLDFVNPGFTEISAQLGVKSIIIRFQGLTEGDYTGQTTIDGRSFNNNTVSYQFANNLTTSNFMDGALDDFKVTEYGVEGEYLTGSFSGNLTIRDEVPESFLISGEFRVKVTNEEYDGTFIDIITEGYRLVIPNVTGSLSSEFSTLFYVRRADNGKIDFIVREIGFHEYDVVGTIALISEYRIGYLNNPSGPSLDQEITHFGEVGEMVSGFNEVPYINVFQPELGDQNLYFKFNVLRLEE